MCVAADATGKKMSFLWSFHSSLATKSSSTRPQQVLKLVPKIIALEVTASLNLPKSEKRKQPPQRFP
ncbi:hypothetical protein Taro_007637 [Colocasia esculenta]|uniref:Uncharacterized protein n=1 Tax=Colocasia esculenta TaxID=4460 RepID=A0A843TVY2_COLES|nr:hypothetical protein [Colocasia esculenta]